MPPRLTFAGILLPLLAAAGPAPADDGPAAAKPAGAGIGVVRATVQIRQGDRRGSGTVVASAPGETLVLTAAHVVKGGREVQVELHRHNLGPSMPALTEGGGWPRLVSGTVVASDPAGDAAVVRLRFRGALPYVARFDPDAPAPRKGDVLTSVGIDRALFLTRWSTTVLGDAAIDIGQGGGGPGRYTVTTRFPDHGRSGGGLFRADGTVAGLCTGQLSLRAGGPKVGVFATPGAIDRVVRAASGAR